MFVGLLILISVSSYCDNQIDGLCTGFSVLNYIFQSVVIIAILICIIINISVHLCYTFHYSQHLPFSSHLNIMRLQFVFMLVKLLSHLSYGHSLHTS